VGGRHGRHLGDVFAVKVGDLLCVREVVDCHGACVVVYGFERAVPLHFVELRGYDVSYIVGCGFWDVDVDQKGACCYGVS
jgi:hypothetical protein